MTFTASLHEHRCVMTDDVTAQDLARARIGQHLDEAVVVIDRLPVRRAVVWMGGSGVGDALLLGRLLGDAHASDLWRAEDRRRRHGVIVDRGQLLRIQDVVGNVGRLEVGVVLELRPSSKRTARTARSRSRGEMGAVTRGLCTGTREL